MTLNVLNHVAQHLQQSQRILFITGAGMSADSGLPTYRGIGGLYNGRLTAHDIPIEVALSGQMLTRSPEITWQYLYEIERACRGASYNRGHEIIREIQQHIPDTWVLTQNIDGFHRQVGCEKLIEIHGRLYDLFCTYCDYKTTVESYVDLNIPPTCPKCDHLVRPDVVLFGEMLPSSALSVLTKQLTKGFDIVFSIGTTSVFPYISAPVQMARKQGKIAVEINPSTTEVSHLVNYRLTGGATDILTQLWQLIDK